MNKRPTFLVLNDRAEYNLRYRQRLIELLNQHGHVTESIGLFDKVHALPILLLRLLFGRQGSILSSNLKTNLMVLVFASRQKILILNGMGRYRDKRVFRLFLTALVLVQRRARIIVQNYADYRYLRRYCPSAKIFWIPGSGGTRKIVGQTSSAVVVQRDNKIEMVSDDILAFLQRLNPRMELTIVGCTDEEKLDRLFGSIAFTSAGYVDPEEIFQDGRIFLQPTGYGEGFPHTLADAIVSGMDVFISEKEYLRYGLGRLGGERRKVCDGWYRLIISKNLRNAVHVENTTKGVLSVCSQSSV